MILGRAPFHKLRKNSILLSLLGGAALQRCGNSIFLGPALAAEGAPPAHGPEAQPLSLSLKSRSAALHSFSPSASSHRSFSSELVRTLSTVRRARSTKSGGAPDLLLLIQSKICRGVADDAVSSFAAAASAATTSAAATALPLSGASRYF